MMHHGKRGNGRAQGGLCGPSGPTGTADCLALQESWGEGGQGRACPFTHREALFCRPMATAPSPPPPPPGKAVAGLSQAAPLLRSSE